MTEVKIAIEKEMKEQDVMEHYFYKQQYPLHENAVKSLFEDAGQEHVKFEVKEEEIKIDSDGFLYINLQVILQGNQNEVIELTAYHDMDWLYYGKIK